MASHTHPLACPVLVTGGAGYIGSHAVLALRDAGWPVAVLDNLATGHRFAVPDDVPFFEGDVGDAALLAKIFAAQGTRAIMHFAGSLLVQESMANPLKYFANNTANSCVLIEAAIAAGVSHMVFSSTAATYGTPQTARVAEDAPQQPINPYGWSKLMTERMLADTAAAHPFSYAALRYFNVAGADPQGRSGKSTVGSTHLVKIAVEAALGKRASVSVFGTDYATPDGTGVRDYIHVSDLATAHVQALEALLADPARSLQLNCGYGRGYSVLEVLKAVERASGQAILRVMEPRRAGDPPVLVADNAKIRAALPWQPLHDDIDAMVRHALAWEERLPLLQQQAARAA